MYITFNIGEMFGKRKYFYDGYNLAEEFLPVHTHDLVLA